jgi:pimeloyl-ACP methyl ester carboxylesterase
MGRVDAAGVGIDYELVGQGQPVVLLHGWPDSGPELAPSGTCAGRGRVPGGGTRPAWLRALRETGGRRGLFASGSDGDVLAILADLNIARAHLVGHDWGAALVWQLALIAPGSVDHLVVLSVGHPVTFRRTLQQREKSWYMLLFLFPGIAERWLSADNWANFRTWARHPDADEVIAELESADSLTPGLNWYRANARPESWLPPPPQLPPVQAATMGVWSTSDTARTEIQMTDSAQNVAGPWRYERLDGPGHWMQLEAPEQVNALLLDFLPRDGDPSAIRRGACRVTPAPGAGWCRLVTDGTAASEQTTSKHWLPDRHETRACGHRRARLRDCGMDCHLHCGYG